jgi:hypothetical protein
MIEHKKEFWGGFAMMVGFVIVLVIFFAPTFKGRNGLNYLDNLYNSISKGSAYYISELKKESNEFMGSSIKLTLKIVEKPQAAQTVRLFRAGGANVSQNGSLLEVSGDLGKILENCLADADAMYDNNGSAVSEKYGCGERQALYNWWVALKEMDKDLKKQKKFKEAKIVGLVSKKAVESAYNYYGIDPQKITDKLGVIVFSLAFYVVYTMWYGFAFMFMFEGWGMKLDH